MQLKIQQQDALIRFSVLHRFLHLVVMIGFTGLAATGLALGFSSTAPAKAFMWLVGGPSHSAWMHRFFAVITYGCVIVHGAWFLYYKLIMGQKLTGPDSVVPSLKDLKDFKENISYFLGYRNSPPDFDKFTYMEKIDYWAIFIGMNTMGLTGLMLWYPEWVTLYLPGFFINIAQVLHFFEAILAVVVKFFIHIGLAHFRPSVYPADMSIFTGKTTAERIREEHPGQWRTLTEPRNPEGENGKRSIQTEP